MSVLLFLFFLMLLFVFLFYFLTVLISFLNVGRAKVSSFESGFLSLGKIQNSFSIHFFIVMLMFVIFDLEVVMLLGLLISDATSFISFVLLLGFIMFGFYMEWFYGKLIWLVFWCVCFFYS